MIAILGIYRNNVPTAGGKRFFGLNRFGAVLFFLSTIGLFTGIIKEALSLSASRRQQKIQDLRDRQLTEVAADIKELRKTAYDPRIAQRLAELGGRLSAIASDRPPDWVPRYPGAALEEASTHSDELHSSGGFSFSTTPFRARGTLTWHQEKLVANRLTITAAETTEVVGGRVVAYDASGRRQIWITHPYPMRIDVRWEEKTE